MLSMFTKIKRFIVRKMCVGEKQRCDYTTFQRNLRMKSSAVSGTRGRLGASHTLSLPEKASHATGAAVEKVTSEGLGKTHPMA